MEFLDVLVCVDYAIRPAMDFVGVVVWGNSKNVKAVRPRRVNRHDKQWKRSVTSSMSVASTSEVLRV